MTNKSPNRIPTPPYRLPASGVDPHTTPIGEAQGETWARRVCDEYTWTRPRAKSRVGEVDLSADLRTDRRYCISLYLYSRDDDDEGWLIWRRNVKTRRDAERLYREFNFVEWAEDPNKSLQRVTRGLSSRTPQILAMRAAGESNAAIAERLGITQDAVSMTVRRHAPELIRARGGSKPGRTWAKNRPEK